MNTEQLITKLRQQRVTIGLKGDQIDLRIPQNLNAQEIIALVKAQKAEIIAYLKNNQKATLKAIEPVGPRSYYEASVSQQATLLATLRRNPEAGTEFSFNINLVLELANAHVPAIGQAFNALIERHEVLRTTLTLVNGQVYQKVHEAANYHFSVEQIDLRAAANKEAKLKALKAESIIFDFIHGPLLKARLVQIENHQHVLLFTIHHSLADKWSVDIIEKELMVLYSAFARGGTPDLPPVTVQFKDYVHWCRERAVGQGADKAFWLNYLDALPQQNVVSSLGGDAGPQETYREKLGREIRDGIGYRPMTTKEEGQFFGIIAKGHFSKGWGYGHNITGKRFALVEKLAQASSCGMSSTIIAMFHRMLVQISGCQDQVVTLNAMQRHNYYVKDIIGMLTNAVYVRPDYEAGTTPIEVVRNVNRHVLKVYEHYYYPVETLVNELNVPLNDVSKIFLNIINMNTQKLDTSLYVGHDKQSVRHPYFDLDISVRIYKDALNIDCSYTAQGFNDRAIEQVFQTLDAVIDESALLTDKANTLTEVPN